MPLAVRVDGEVVALRSVSPSRAPVTGSGATEGGEGGAASSKLCIFRFSR